jgi:hypothetical protein
MTALPHSPPRPAPNARVVIETVLLSVRLGELHYRVRSRDLPDGAHPDALARELAGFAPWSPDPARLLHSTSWRFEGGSVVLTYAALPDPQPAQASPIDPARPAPYAADPLAPALDGVGVHDAAVHACRHLAYLRQTDPVVALAAGAAPELWESIGVLHPAVAGLLVQPHQFA